MAKRKTLFLVDGSNHAFRVQFALPPRHASNGFPTRLLYGFTLLFQKMMRTYRPDYCVVSFDSGKTFRHERYPAYKGHRPEMPEDMRRQWGHLPELVEAFGYRCIQSPGYEADDVLGTLAKKFEDDELDIYLVTSDKDFCQLMSPRIHMLDDRKGKVLKLGDVKDKMGVEAGSVVDLLGLAGDSSDNIPGVPGIGAKTASSLLSQYGDMEGILAAAAEGKVKGKRGANLVEFADDARLSRELATIAIDVPIEDSLEDLAPQGIRADALRTLFDDWEFGAAARKLLPDQVSITDDHYRAVANDAEWAEVRQGILKAKRCGLCLHGEPWEGVGLAYEDQVVYVPLTPRMGVQLDADMIKAELLELLNHSQVEWIAHDMKALLHSIWRAGGEVARIGGDTRILDYVLMAHRRSHGLTDLAQRHLGHTMAVTPRQTPMDVKASIRPGAEAAHLALLLHDRLAPKLTEGQQHIYRDVELPLLPILAHMEHTGIRLDLEALATIHDDIAARVQEAEQQCHDLAGRAFKVSSTKEVAALLFDELGLPPGKKTKTGFSTASAVLEGLADAHPLPMAILNWRSLSKLLNTYLSKLPQYVAEDGRIHTTFNQAVAATGRLSSTEPNLQNIPIRTFEGRRIREAFVPDEGCVFLSCDYSQVELRILAHCCAGGALAAAFSAGEDIHARTASEVWGVPMDEVGIDLRSAAKAINFGLLYGMSAFRLARDLQISREEAQAHMDAYFGRMPEVEAWIAGVKEQCRQEGFVDTLFGRRRLIPEITSRTFNERSMGEREAVNTVIQGTAADVIKKAMIAVDARLKELDCGARLLLQVHDELLLEVPEAELVRVRDEVVRTMEEAVSFEVPLDVTAASGLNWNQAHG